LLAVVEFPIFPLRFEVGMIRARRTASLSSPERGSARRVVLPLSATAMDCGVDTGLKGSPQ